MNTYQLINKNGNRVTSFKSQSFDNAIKRAVAVSHTGKKVCKGFYTAMTLTLVCNGEEVAKFDGSNWK